MFFGLKNQVYQRNGRSGNSYGESIEFSGELRQYDSHGFGRSGRGGDHVFISGSSSAKVFVTDVEDVLSIGYSVDGGD